MAPKVSCPANSGPRSATLTKAATGRTIGELNVEDYDEAESFDRDNVALFQAIAAVSGKRYVVDSSKHVARLALLIKNPALDVFPVFLLRDPKGTDLLVARNHRRAWSSSSEITSAPTAKSTSW